MKGLAASTGQSDDAVEMPFISGAFEYGGRAAARRKVYMFANKAQDQRSLTDATVQFLGVFKTDKKASPLAITDIRDCSTCLTKQHQASMCSAKGLKYALRTKVRTKNAVHMQWSNI